MNLELVSLDGVKFKAEAYSVVLPTADGEIAVYPGHEPLVSLLVPGVITVRKHKDDSDAQSSYLRQIVLPYPR